MKTQTFFKVLKELPSNRMFELLCTVGMAINQPYTFLLLSLICNLKFYIHPARKKKKKKMPADINWKSQHCSKSSVSPDPEL